MRYKPLQNITAWFNRTSAFQKLQVSEALGLPNICILMSPVERLRLDDCASKKTSLFFSLENMMLTPVSIFRVLMNAGRCNAANGSSFMTAQHFQRVAMELI